MENEKKCFLIYSDYIELFDKLNDRDFRLLFNAIKEYNLNNIIIELPEYLDFAFVLIKKQIDRDTEKWNQSKERRTKAGKIGAKKRWNINGQMANDSKNSNAINRIDDIANDSDAINAIDECDCHNEIALMANMAVNVNGNVNGNGNVNVNVSNKKKICSSGDERDALPEQNQAETEKKKEQAEKRKREVEDNERRFNTFWEAYPKKTSKKTAMQSWNKLKVTDKMLEEIMAGLNRYRASPQWQKDNGQFIPHPSTFLNQERWKDETEPITGAPPGNNPPEKTQNRKGRHKLDPNKNYDFVDAELLAIIESMEAE